MKKLIILFISLFLCIGIYKCEEEPSAVTLNSEAGIIMEASTNKVLFEKDAEKEMAPASMTKIMTLLLIMEEIDKGNLKYDDEVQISKNAANMGGSQIYLEENSKSTVEELVTSIGIGSANDVVVTKKQSQVIEEEIIIKQHLNHML